MGFDLAAAVRFAAGNARNLDRRRLHHLLGDLPAQDVMAALDGYRNPDGGYGWALEPDLRSVTSQPVAAMHALEVMAEVRDTGPGPVALLDWLMRHSLDDGGMPFALPFADATGSAPHWAGADPGVSSLQMTAQLAGHAHRLARHRPDVGGHPWLAAATGYCLGAIERIEAAPHAYELMFALRFLDAVDAPQLLERLARFVRMDGPTPVEGGADGEVLYPLDFTPHPGTASRKLFDPGAVAADRERLAAGQQADGGWTVTFPAYSPAAAVEWRGYATVAAVAVLRDTPQ
ncbi:hypothetical protein GCM10010112_70580 [Actinoplanes lobatus]|uniref:Uncharacterized protein n=1 Tax=Actinoplanes lobatus TaxID=113568 RepID=A0A7W7HLX0_9ACTN|nr:hypothetical protein [Actinoplanes lobatus]MBB4752964.1 hypothetical protein [Actinoplanes lobatus]GGN87697.1 hypothetical protein GCM10010112_70580 [Actinoplanes lobatus]GIE39571.1 hypothetical protein Alo02nite_24690 [Actinoplanes lobatus]